MIPYVYWALPLSTATLMYYSRNSSVWMVYKARMIYNTVYNYNNKVQDKLSCVWDQGKKLKLVSVLPNDSGGFTQYHVSTIIWSIFQLLNSTKNSLSVKIREIEVRTNTSIRVECRFQASCAGPWDLVGSPRSSAAGERAISGAC